MSRKTNPFRFRNVKDYIPFPEYNKIMRKFAERLKELRQERGLSIAVLGKQTDIGAASIFRWEQGERDIKSDYLIRLSRFFDVTTDYLLGLED